MIEENERAEAIFFWGGIGRVVTYTLINIFSNGLSSSFTFNRVGCSGLCRASISFVNQILHVLPVTLLRLPCHPSPTRFISSPTTSTTLHPASFPYSLVGALCPAVSLVYSLGWPVPHHETQLKDFVRRRREKK